LIGDKKEIALLISLIIKDLTDTNAKYKSKIAKEVANEIKDFTFREVSPFQVTSSLERPNNYITLDETNRCQERDDSSTKSPTTKILDRPEKQQFISLIIKLVESSSKYISSALDEQNYEVKTSNRILLDDTPATSLIKLGATYERSVNVKDKKSYRTLLLKYQQYILEDFKSDILVVKGSEFARYALSSDHKEIVKNIDLWTSIIDYCKMLTADDLEIFLDAAILLLRILSDFTDDTYGIKAAMIGASLRRCTKRIDD
jgi:hypothetical protein